MLNKTSNSSMEDPFNILRKIQQVDAPDELLQRINQRLAIRGNSIIPRYWVKRVAAIFIGLYLVEGYALVKKDREIQSQTIESIVPINNNLLYHD
jgi:hypothetical protein